MGKDVEVPLSKTALETLRRRHRELLLRRAAAHDCKLQQVAEQLFIGSIGAVLTPGMLKESGVSHVLCVASGVKEDTLQRKAPDASISVAKLQDTADDPSALLRALPMLLGFLDAVLQRGHSILVCSFRGWSRSAAVVIAYLMVTAQCTLREAALCVTRVRECAVPNPGFVLALMALEAAVTAEKSTGVDQGVLDLSQEDGERRLLELVQAALVVLPSLEDKGPLPQTLWLQDDLELTLPEGLCDLSEDKLNSEIALLSSSLSLDQSRVGGGTKLLESPDAAETRASSNQGCGNHSPSTSGRMQAIAVLEAKKAEALACDDFAEAARIRDLLRSLATGTDKTPQSTHSTVGEVLQCQSSAVGVANENAGPSNSRGQSSETALPADGNACQARDGIEDMAALEAQKAEALLRNDFAEAARLRDRLRVFTKESRGPGHPSSLGTADRRQELLRMKEVAIKSDDFAQAAKLRDELLALELQDVSACEGADVAHKDSMTGSTTPAMPSSGDTATTGTARLEQAGTKKEKDVVDKILNSLEAKTDSLRLEPAVVEQAVALTCSQKCFVYPVATVLAFLFMSWMNAGLLRAFPDVIPKEL